MKGRRRDIRKERKRVHEQKRGGGGSGGAVPPAAPQPAPNSKLQTTSGAVL